MKTTIKGVLAALMLSTPAHATGEWQMVFGLGIMTVADHDKVKHFGAGMITAGVARKAGATFWQSCATSLAVGVLKEVADKLGNGTSEINDALATGAGCLWFERRF